MPTIYYSERITPKSRKGDISIMMAFEIIRNNESENFGAGSRKFFSTYDKAADYIFNHDAKFFFRGTSIEETREGLEGKISDNNWETVRREDNASELDKLIGIAPETEYYHILAINID